MKTFKVGDCVRATAHATHLRKKNIMDIKFAEGKFTRFK
jgi:hypothetical protein